VKQKLILYQIGPTAFHIPHGQGVCYLGTKQIVKDLWNQLHSHINGSSLVQYWWTQCQLTEEVWWDIDWEVISKAMTLLPANKHQWVTKFVSSHFAHGKNMQQWKFFSSTQCPQCPEILETKLHVVRCRETEAQCLWMSTFTDLTKWLKTQNMAPQIMQQLLTALKHWYTEAPRPTEGNPLLEAQNQIRQDLFMDGWLSWQWRTTQEAYWAHIWSRNQVIGGLHKSWRSCRTPLGIYGSTAMTHYIPGMITDTTFWKQMSTRLFRMCTCKAGQHYHHTTSITS